MPVRAPRLSRAAARRGATRHARRAAAGVLAAAAVAAAVAAEAIGGPAMPERLGDLAAGLALLGGGAVAWTRRPRGGGAGAVAWTRRPRAGAGPLMVLSGLAWFAGDLAGVLLYSYRGPLVHLLLTYPSGRGSSTVTRVVIAASYATALVPDAARSEWATLALVAAVLLVAGGRRRAAGGAERRARAAALAATALLSAALALAAMLRLLDAGGETVAVWALYGAVAAIACGLTADLLWGRWGRAALTGLVVDLGDDHEPQALRAALARTLGDPELELAYRIDERSGWVDESGRPVPPPGGDAGGRRARTLIGDEDAPVAALVHDPAALSDPDVIASVSAAAGLAIANVRLQADVAGRVRDVAASRRRLVEAGDAERRRLGEKLGEGPEARLAEVAARIERLAAGTGGEAAAVLRHLSDETAATRVQLQEFAHGIRPRTLTAGGLRPALAELARQPSIPVEVEAPDSRFAPAQELVSYFVCSEALANVAKYAGASRARVTVAASGDELHVRVADDGAGGADPRRGSGLRGLADRVEALGGRLRVESPPGGGTLVEAVLPTAGGGAP